MGEPPDRGIVKVKRVNPEESERDFIESEPLERSIACAKPSAEEFHEARSSAKGFVYAKPSKEEFDATEPSAGVFIKLIEDFSFAINHQCQVTFNKYDMSSFS